MMTLDIHLLGDSRTNSDSLKRLVAHLAKAFEQGADLGSRTQHIQASGSVIEQLAAQLRSEINILGPLLTKIGLQDMKAESTLHLLVEALEKLGQAARQFPKSDQLSSKMIAGDSDFDVVTTCYGSNLPTNRPRSQSSNG